MLCYACHVWVSVVCLWEMWNNLQQLVLSSHTWAPENSSCPISTKSIYLSHLTLLLKNTASEVKPKNSAYTCKCLKTTNRKTTAKKKKLQKNILVRWRQSTVIDFYIFLPSPTVIGRLWVSVPELGRTRMPACSQGKIKRLHPLSPHDLCPTCASQGLLQSQEVGDEQLNNFPKVSKWVITTPAQTLCGFKIVRTRRRVLIREAWVCVLGAPRSTWEVVSCFRVCETAIVGQMYSLRKEIKA